MVDVDLFIQREIVQVLLLPLLDGVLVNRVLSLLLNLRLLCITAEPHALSDVIMFDANIPII